MVKQKNGRRNRYQIQAHLPLPEPITQERTIGDVLAFSPAPRGAVMARCWTRADDLGRFPQPPGRWP